MADAETAEQKREREKRAAEEWETSRIKTLAKGAKLAPEPADADADAGIDPLPESGEPLSPMDRAKRASIARKKEKEDMDKWEALHNAGNRDRSSGASPGKPKTLIEELAKMSFKEDECVGTPGKVAAAAADAPAAKAADPPPSPSPTKVPMKDASSDSDPAADLAPPAGVTRSPTRVPMKDKSADPTPSPTKGRGQAPRAKIDVGRADDGADGDDGATRVARLSMSFDNLNALSQQEVDNASTPSPKKSATLARQRSASFDNLASLQADEAGKGQAQAQAAGVKKGLKGLDENEAIARAEMEAEQADAPPVLQSQASRAEMKRQEEIEAAAKWEARIGTIKRPGLETQASIADMVGDLTPEMAAARRREEIEKMAAWEAKVGKGGKVTDLDLGADTSLKTGTIKTPKRQAVKSSADGNDARASPSYGRPRSSSFGFEKASPDKSATFGRGSRGFGAFPDDRNDQTPRIARSSSFGDLTASPKKSMGGPIQKAMAEFMETANQTDMLTAFERVKVLAGCEVSSGRDFFNEFKSKVAHQVDFKRGHLIRAVAGKMRKIKDGPNKHNDCAGVRMVIVGAGPVGLRAAVTFALLGADVTVLEMRTRFTRHNILHLWDWVCTDLISLGFSNADLIGKSYYHIGTKKIQFTLARIALLLGVRIHSGVKFEATIPPATPNAAWAVKVGIHDKTGMHDSCPKALPANLLMDCGGAGGPVLSACGFKCKKMKINSSVGIVAHFKKSSADRQMEEFSFSAQFKQQMFKELREKGLHLENCVYYQGDTHYFVMTPTIGALKAYGVVKKGGDPAKVCVAANMDMDKLKSFAREVAEYFGLPPNTPYIEDTACCSLFDFSSRSMCKTQCKVLDVKHSPSQLLVSINGDALIEPFWPEGLGINRGFLSVFDSAFLVQQYYSEGSISKENIKKYYKASDRAFNIMSALSGHTKKETLRDDAKLYSLEPSTRYLKWKSGW